MQWLVKAARAGLAVQLKGEIEEHISTLGLDLNGDNGNLEEASKDLIRSLHAHQRAGVLDRENRVLRRYLSQLLPYFAEGVEVEPENIRPELVEIQGDGKEALLFRLATTLWSVPVSKGYGRRMRFLVMDRQNGKLIGVFALGDPVFNLRVRDEWIGWTVQQRERRLVSVMDAFVVGAVPPYNRLLGGKLVTGLIGSAEVASRFEQKYARTKGVISGKIKSPKLALVTVTSALGRSSIYNRVRLGRLVELVPVGRTVGYGHFHVSDHLFHRMRDLLKLHGHDYADGHHFGAGPNWRMRVIREALATLGMDGDLLRHGVTREVFAMPVAENWREYLCGRARSPRIHRSTVDHIAYAALLRWVIPRSQRFPDFRLWTRGDTARLLRPE